MKRIWLNATEYKTLDETLHHLRMFYELSTNNKLVPLLIMSAVADVANIPEDKSWTENQRLGWLGCRARVKLMLEVAIRCLMRRVVEVVFKRNKRILNLLNKMNTPMMKKMVDDILKVVIAGDKKETAFVRHLLAIKKLCDRQIANET